MRSPCLLGNIVFKAKPSAMKKSLGSHKLFLNRKKHA